MHLPLASARLTSYDVGYGRLFRDQGEGDDAAAAAWYGSRAGAQADPSRVAPDTGETRTRAGRTHGTRVGPKHHIDDTTRHAAQSTAGLHTTVVLPVPTGPGPGLDPDLDPDLDLLKSSVADTDASSAPSRPDQDRHTESTELRV
ncbi:unnamed protein product [Diplocarpon coronariae]